MPVIPATWEVQIGESWSKAIQGKRHETLFEKKAKKLKPGGQDSNCRVFA
jgi:hypothetical protein